MAVGLYSQGHITRRQLRIYFAAHEMAEQRRYAKKQTAKERPVFLIEQIAKLTGGRGSQTALRALASDVNALARTGLVSIEAHAIQFAKSTDALAVGEGRGQLSAFLEQLPNLRRTVPVPRRLIRALAAGFGKAETLYIAAFLLRSVFWKKKEGLFTVDGRMKGSWVSTLFDLSRRSVTAARRHLIDIGWIEPLEVHQMIANLYGVHDVVNIHWKPGSVELTKDVPNQPTEPPTALPSVSVDNCLAEEEAAGCSSTLPPDSAGRSSTPRNKKALPTEDLYTRKLGSCAPDPATGGSRKRKDAVGAALRPPTLRDVHAHDLKDTERLLVLHAQAEVAGHDVCGESGRLEFLAMAHRALTRGKNPGALLLWLLTNRKGEFITQADEDAAASRLSNHLNAHAATNRPAFRNQTPQRSLTEEERLVEGCLRAAKRHRGLDPFAIVQQGRGWNRERWDSAHARYQQAQMQQWCGDEDA